MKTTEPEKNLQNKQIPPATNNAAKPVKPIIVQKEQRFDSCDPIPKTRGQK